MMRKSIAVVLISTLVLGGCGSSRFNPLNWFGRGQSSENAPVSTNPLIPNRRGGVFSSGRAAYAGPAVDQITRLTVERIPGGAILRIEALAAAQGSYEVVVEPATFDDLPVKGVLAYTLRAKLPRGRLRVGNDASRRIVAAHSLSDDQLAGVRQISVAGKRNTLTTRR